MNKEEIIENIRKYEKILENISRYCGDSENKYIPDNTIEIINILLEKFREEIYETVLNEQVEIHEKDSEEDQIYFRGYNAAISDALFEIKYFGKKDD